jgi:microcystin-dependent protein
MGQPYIGEIRLFGGSFAPAGWAFCWGQQLAISENDTLFNLIGTTYGGDGQTTFNLPNLASRVPVHMGAGIIGEMAGVESVTLTTSQIPAHNHAFVASTNLATQPTPQNNLLGQAGTFQWYRGTPPTQQLAANELTPTGGSQPHDNMIPYLGLSFIISLFGIFPSQT